MKAFSKNIKNTTRIERIQQDLRLKWFSQTVSRVHKQGLSVSLVKSREERQLKDRLEFPFAFVSHSRFKEPPRQKFQ